MNWQECNVVMLPTEKAQVNTIMSFEDIPILIHCDTIDDIVVFDGKIFNHLYITNPNEEIKVGDWYINTCGNTKPVLFKCDTIQEVKDCNKLPHWCKKIIATTDESLKIEKVCVICDGNGEIVKCTNIRQSNFKCKHCNGRKSISISLSRLSNEFLKKFCELGGIDKVLVKYERGVTIVDEKQWENHKFHLKIAPDNTISIKPVPEERLYTRDEVIEILNKYHSKFIAAGFASTPFQDWIKENL